MVKLQIGENLITLTKQEQDFLFQLLDEKYDYIQNVPTFNAIRNWLCDLGCHPQVVKSEVTKEVADYFAKVVEKLNKEEAPMVDDPWNNDENKSQEELKELYKKWSSVDLLKTKDYTTLRTLLGKLLQDDSEKGYYIAL